MTRRILEFELKSQCEPYMHKGKRMFAVLPCEGLVYGDIDGQVLKGQTVIIGRKKYIAAGPVETYAISRTPETPVTLPFGIMVEDSEPEKELVKVKRGKDNAL